GRAAARPDVIDFRQTCSGHRADGHNHADTIYGSRICRGTRDNFRGCSALIESTDTWEATRS
ncbi:MAG: hypothetical protein ACRDLZ_08405, partial [Gaiellaceae bacterium]